MGAINWDAVGGGQQPQQQGGAIDWNAVHGVTPANTPIPVSPQHAAIAARVAGDQISQDAQSGPSIFGEFARSARDYLAGGVRGAGSIGATLAYPVDKVTDLVMGDRSPTMSGLVTGQQPISRNQERRQAMDWALGDMGADTNSPAYSAGKLTAEVAGTAGAGGAVANGVRALPAAVSAARPIAALADSIGSGGFSVGNGTGSAVGNLAIRGAGGAINGGVSAGMVDPSTAGTGAVVGGAIPLVAQGGGAAVDALSKALRGPVQSPQTAAAIKAARAAGYVIPPSQANPSLLNRALEGLAGKVSVAQKASAANQDVTNGLVARDLGLPANQPITSTALAGARSSAGQAYGNVSSLGEFDAAGASLPGSANVQRGYDNLTLAPKATVDAADLVQAWKQANADANGYFSAYGRDANPETLAKAHAASRDANAVHDFMTARVGAQESKTPDQLMADLAAGRLAPEDYIIQALRGVQRSQGAPGAVEALNNARVQIAKTHTAEDALNDVTGTIDAGKLAKALAKGTPLTGGMREAADFAGRFPKAAQTPERMGSLPGTSPLDWAVSSAMPSKLGAMLTLGARPAARALAFSPLVQNRLIQSQEQNALARALMGQDFQLLGKSVPVLTTDR